MNTIIDSKVPVPNSFLLKIKKFVMTHKIVSAIIFIILCYFLYFVYGKINPPVVVSNYITTNVSRDTIITSVTGSGQVSTSNQVDVKPKVSGDVLSINVISGQKVSKGQVLATLDNTDAQKTVRDAEISLETTKLSLEKLQIQNSDANMNANLVKAYDDGFTAVSDTFSDLTNTLNGLENVFAQENISSNTARLSGNTALDYRNQADKSYYEALNAFQVNRIKFRLLDRNSSKADIEAIINQTYDTTKLLADAIKNTKNLVDYLAEDTNKASNFTATQTTLALYASTIDGHISSLFSAKTNINNYKDAFPNSNLDIQNSLLSVKQKENALQDAKDALLDYVVRSPFDGVVGKISAQKGDSASSGTAIATIITNQKLALITLNEVDVAKIAPGDKSTLTFDAITDLSVVGNVASIDALGVVTQGVVTYSVKISFDTGDNRIKSGMSVSTNIITDVKQDVLVVPNSAIKTQGTTSYVQMFDAPLATPIAGAQGSPSSIPPRNQTVQTGASNDNYTEIVSGLKEGDIIVTKIINSTVVTSATQAPSLLNSISGGGSRSGATGAIRSATTGRGN